MAIIICEILTDYQKFYTGKVAGKFAVKWLLKITPCLAYIATLLPNYLVKILMSEKKQLTINYKII